MSSRRLQNSNAHLILPVLFLCALALGLQIRWANNHKDLFVDPNMVNYLQTMNPEVDIRILCWACDGTGNYTVNQDGTEAVIPCPLSFGMGFLEVHMDPAKHAICSSCGGLAATLDESSLIPEPCATCNATGIMEAEDPFSRMSGPIRTLIVECHHCNAQGRVYDAATQSDINCPICLGKGSREIRMQDDVDGLCPNDGGMGRLINPETGTAETCSRCSGRGLIRPGDES